MFNFMFDYANRFTKLKQLWPTFDRLLPGVDWRTRIGAVEADPSARPEDRKRVFLSCFKDAVRHVGGYRYIADVDIQYPGKDRTFYFVVYGTRRPPGIEVFRDCQLKALETQSSITGRKKIEAAEAGGQFELLDSMNEMRQDPRLGFLRSEREKARKLLLQLVAPDQPARRWGQLWPEVLAEHAVRRADLGRLAAELRKTELLTFPDWAPRKQIPDDAYRVRCGGRRRTNAA